MYACVTSAVVSSTANSSKKKKKRKVEWTSKEGPYTKSTSSNDVGVAVGVADTTTTRHRLQCLDCRYSACQCAVTTQTKAETKKIRKAGLDCRYSACQCAVTTQTKAETKKRREAATAAATQKIAETKKIREAATAAATAAATQKKKIRKAATAAATQKKAEKKKAETNKIREAATDNRVSALTAKKMKEAADQKPPQGQEKWVDELGNPTPIYKYSIEEVRLINMKFSPNNPDEKKQYNSTKVFTGNFPIDLSLKKEQELALAWVGDENTIFKLQQDQQDQQEQPDSPQYINIPDNLHPAINLRETLRTGVKLLKLKSVNDKELMVLFCQAIDLLFTVRITHKSFWNAMLYVTDSNARDQAEGFYTWKGRFNHKFFCTVFLMILKSLNLTETDIDELMKVLPPTMRSIAHLCQLAYKFMGLLDLWICERNDPHCAFGAVGNWESILEQPYESFQNNRLLRLKGITIDANDTRELFQGAVNQVLSGGSLITTGWEESKPISFGPMLVTVSDSEKGAIQLRDVVLEANGFAKVLDK
jgi:hypothetical protein